MASGGGSKFGVALLMLLVLCAAGGVNYHRNLQSESQDEGPRPLAGYDDAGLEALAEAYRMEIETLEARRSGSRGQANPDAARGAFIGDNVREFEKVQRSSQKLRDLLGEIAERQGRLAEIEREQQHRASLGAGGLEIHLRRLLTI